MARRMARRMESKSASISRSDSLALQKLIADADELQLRALALRFREDFFDVANDLNGNFVASALVARGQSLALLLPYLERNFLLFAESRFACRVLNAALHRGAGKEVAALAVRVLLCFRHLAASYYGHFVIVTCIAHCYTFRGALAEVFVAQAGAMPATHWLDIALAFLESPGISAAILSLVSCHAYETAARQRAEDCNYGKLLVLLKRLRGCTRRDLAAPRESPPPPVLREPPRLVAAEGSAQDSVGYEPARAERRTRRRPAA